MQCVGVKCFSGFSASVPLFSSVLQIQACDPVCLVPLCFLLSILKSLSVWMGDPQGYSMRSLVVVSDRACGVLVNARKHSMEAVSLYS